MEDEQAASEHALASARQELASHTMAASPMPNDVQQHEVRVEKCTLRVKTTHVTFL